MKYKAMKIKTHGDNDLAKAILHKLVDSLGYKCSFSIDPYKDNHTYVIACNEGIETLTGSTGSQLIAVNFPEVTIDELMQMEPEDVRESPIAKGHNPDGLTEEQVGVSEGWRLLEPDEIAEREPTIDIQCYWVTDLIDIWGLNPDGSSGDDRRASYRTKKPEGYFLPKKEPVSASEVIAWAESQREWHDAIGEVLRAKLKLQVALEKLKEASELRKETT